MAKAIIEGFVYLYAPLSTSENPIYAFHETELSGDSFVKVVAHTIEAEIAANFNPIPQQLAALNEQKRKLRLKLAEELAALDDKISKLQAITYDVEAA